jgi:hypothetical protein
VRKCLKVNYLGRIKYDFQKSRVTGPWDNMVLVSAKKVKQKFHACVPLNQDNSFSKPLQIQIRTGMICTSRSDGPLGDTVQVKLLHGLRNTGTSLL